jgi:4-hydroxy-tetrahydrodipicolinate synthase
MDKKLSVIVIVVTPFKKDGQLDEVKFRQQLGRIRDAGCTVFVGGSGSGEGYALTLEERSRMLAIAIEEANGRMRVLADGVESRTSQEMIDCVQTACRHAVDAVRIMPLDIGHGARPSNAELERYNCAGIEASTKAVILTSHQAAGYVLPIDLIEKLVKRYPNVIGVNYGGGDIPYIAELIRRVGDRVDVHCAGPQNGVPVLALGGNGFMGGEGNFAPGLVASVIAAWQAKDMQKLAVDYGKLMVFSAVLGRHGGNTRGLKPLLNAFGMPGGELRDPRVAISDQELDVMVKEVLALDIPGLPPPARR